MSEDLKTVVSLLPDTPGVYQFFDAQNQLLYIGKAKNLKNRVASYFSKHQERDKIYVLVKKIHRIETINVETEFEALLLESTLIKKYRPPYNCSLKDDKSYPWLVLLQEDFPRIIPTRAPHQSENSYFGPYPAVKQLKHLMDLLFELYPLRTCNLTLSEKNIASGKFTPCLKYHIHKCEAPCTGNISAEKYQSYIQNITEILNGKTHRLIKLLKTEMTEAAKQWEFEKAHALKEKLQLIENYQSKYTVVGSAIEEADVFSLTSDQHRFYVNYLRISYGSLIFSYTQRIQNKIEESPEDLLLMAIMQMRERFSSTAQYLIVPFNLSYNIPKVKTIVPRRGDELKLLELSQRNAQFYILEIRKREEKLQPKRFSERIVKTMQKDLNLEHPPYYIECFDNSNLQGTHPVAAMVCFRDGKPSKKEYRHFNIKTVEGPDDFASMEEVIYRRYHRLLEEQCALPDLILVDGGKGQVNAALKSLTALGLEKRIPLLGIAKRLEDIYRPGDSLPLFLDKKSETQRVLQHLRDEAHRFGITHQRQKRQKAGIGTRLTDIAGIGEKTAELLLKKFRSIAKIQAASLEELTALIGKDKAEKVKKET